MLPTEMTGTVGLILCRQPYIFTSTMAKSYQEDTFHSTFPEPHLAHILSTSSSLVFLSLEQGWGLGGNVNKDVPIRTEHSIGTSVFNYHVLTLR